MKNAQVILFALAACLFWLANPSAAQKAALPALQTVPSVDLNRYSGKWYEIGRYPNKFQKQCVGNTSATYTLKEKGRIEVINQCLERDGTTSTAKGEAKVVSGSQGSKLKVRFAPKILSFLSAVWGDYWIIDLDSEYRHVAIGDPKREYFWILSREPKMDDAIYQGILRRAEQMGFQPSRVERTAQNLKAKDSGAGTPASD